MPQPKRVYVVVGGHRKLRAHAVWEEAYGLIPEDHVIHHINGDCSDDALDNLACITRRHHGGLHKHNTVKTCQCGTKFFGRDSPSNLCPGCYSSSGEKKTDYWTKRNSLRLN